MNPSTATLQPPFRIAVLMTCHNRRDKTVECLRALQKQQGRVENEEPRTANQKRRTKNQEPAPPATHDSSPATLYPPPFTLSVFLTDDGCTDGTADAVREVWPEATILQGDGNLYWCGGMRLAWSEAAKTDPDFYLLLNDDTILLPFALQTLAQLASDHSSRSVAVAAIANQAKKVVYGGRNGGNFQLLGECDRPLRCDTMNTNCALIPRVVWKACGGFFHKYTHAMGDFDYGLEVNRKGMQVWQAPGILGFCEANSSIGTWRDTSLSLKKRLFLLHRHPKGLPPGEWIAFCHRNFGWKWPLKVLSPTIRVFLGK